MAQTEDSLQPMASEELRPFVQQLLKNWILPAAMHMILKEDSSLGSLRWDSNPDQYIGYILTGDHKAKDPTN